MSIAIRGENGTCPCRRCQRVIYDSPATRELKKMAKLGLGMGPDVPKRQHKALEKMSTQVLPTPEQAELLRQAHEQVPVWDAEKPEGDDE